MLSSQIPNLYLDKNEKGRGVYTSSVIENNSIIELCPVIVLNRRERLLIHQTRLHDYYFMWDIANESCAIALGYGSIYNHSNSPNAAFDTLLEDEMIRFKSSRKIEAGEEICVDYIALKQEQYGIWFDPVKE